MAEIINSSSYEEYEEFVSRHPQGCFMQSVNWPKVKNNWDYEIIVSRDEENKIIGGMLVLIQKIPYFRSAFLYSPRGPVCDLHNELVLKDLIDGVKMVAKKYKAHSFKMDPDILISDQKFIEIAKGLNLTHFTGGENFETVQARFNYRLYIKDRSQEELFLNLHHKTRYNIRIAQKHGVEVKVCGKEYLDEFERLMKITGERDGFNTRPKEYFERMLDALGDHVRLYIAFYNDIPISAAISTNYARKTCYVYGASDNEYRNVMPNYLIQWEMIKWALETNCTVYDFQGVSGNLDESNPLYGLYRFKKGYNGTLDELAGEFDIIFRPWMNKLINMAISIRENIQRKRA